MRTIVVNFQHTIETVLTLCAIIRHLSRDFLDRNDWLLPKIEEMSGEKSQY